jgi:multicomponent Na+:H+ antiporter subunit G
MNELITVTLVCAGLIFFAAGTVAFLRFPDHLCRLHALTKADNLGLGFVVGGLIFSSNNLFQITKLLLLWLLALTASSTVCFLLAGYTYNQKLSKDLDYDLDIT